MIGTLIPVFIILAFFLLISVYFAKKKGIKDVRRVKMMGEKKTPSLMGKIASLLLLFIGALLISSMLPQLFRFGSVDATTILAFVSGIGLIWGGASLWHKWRMALGIFCVWFGASQFIPLYLSKRGMQVAPDVVKASIFVAATLLVAGIVLIVLQKQKDKIRV